jgi:hypothetical protein
VGGESPDYLGCHVCFGELPDNWSQLPRFASLWRTRQVRCAVRASPNLFLFGNKAVASKGVKTSRSESLETCADMRKRTGYAD